MPPNRLHVPHILTGDWAERTDHSVCAITLRPASARDRYVEGRAESYAERNQYAREFFTRVFGNTALDAVGVILIIAGALLGAAGITLASWLSALAVIVVLLYASFRAFRDVAEERDSRSMSQTSQSQLVMCWLTAVPQPRAT